jgi:hypothetical protein
MNKINSRDQFEAIRALQAKRWLSDPERIREDFIDQQRRLAADIKAGHSPKCGIMKCHSECNKLKGLES